MRIGIIGHRSWIAKEFIKQCDERNECEDYKVEVVLISKNDLSDCENLDALLIIPGKVSQTRKEELEEIELIYQLTSNSAFPQLQILLGSKALPSTDYGMHKLEVELTFVERSAGFGYTKFPIVCRSPAIYGNGQSVDSKMLIPTLKRKELPNEIRMGDIVELIHVADLCRILLNSIVNSFVGINFFEKSAKTIERDLNSDIKNKTLNISFRDLMNLYNAFSNQS